MSDNVKKTQSKTNKTTAKKTSQSNRPGRAASTAKSSPVKPERGVNRNMDREAAADAIERKRKAAAKRDDIIIIIVTLVCILMVLSYIGICGVVGTGINTFIFGLFGWLGYILPFIAWVLTLFIIANKENGVRPIGVVYAVLLSGVLGALIQLAAGGYNEEICLFDYFSNSCLNYEGDLVTYGGLLGGVFVKLFCPFVGKIATVLILIALLLILFVLMTGKPFIMAVFRKIKRRITEFKRRRAIERNEQEFYDESGDDMRYTRHEAGSQRVRYGVRRLPRGRMGTMDISFSKRRDKTEPEAQRNHAQEISVSNHAQRAANGNSIRKSAAGSFSEITAPGSQSVRGSHRNQSVKTPEKTDVNSTMFIPGVGNVRLGKKASLNVKEEEYTEADFAEQQINTAAADRKKDSLKKETSRKQDVYEDNERITPLGVKKLHTGSVSGRQGNNITRIVGIHEPESSDNINDDEDMYASPIKEYDSKTVPSYEEEDDLYPSEQDKEKDWEETESGSSGGYALDSDLAESIRILEEKNRESRKVETPDLSDDTGTEEAGREEAGREEVGREKAGREDIGRKEAEIDDRGSKEENSKNGKIIRIEKKEEKAEDDEEEAVDVEEVKKQYENVTRIGSGAAVFTDMTKKPAKPPVIEYVFPPVSLLNKSKAAQGSTIKKNELEATIQKLQSTFESFGVGVKVTDASVGPTVTRYELLPDQGVKVKTITSLSDDIKLALAASEIRIEAPIPGKAAVGIEVPNRESSPVLFGDLIDTDEFRNSKSNLAFAVGKDIGGKSVVSDIGGMPHALIAGATGSGKSVCINALIMSILFKARPTDVKMIMIDPKRVELVGYNGIPHLLVPVVTDVKKATGVLNWAIAEMDDRYQRFADNGVNNLASYNNLMEERFIEEGREGECTDKLPQILIIVDELNDLMMTANSKEVEADICRLTQLARACGIHVILATQRPSVNVITGTIKANIPTRIAFSVSSIVDSRTIIDQAGAEKLLGKGDMLFYPQGYAKPVRLQGAYVSDGEVAKVVKFIKEQYKEIKYNEIVRQHIEDNSEDRKSSAKEEAAQADANANDEFYEDAARLIIKKQKASVGMLQREFRIGFNRAARIMDKLSEDGIVGPEDSTKPRKILMTIEDFEKFLLDKG